jgi:hypothetical protein
MKKSLIVSLAVLFMAALVPQSAAAGVGFKAGLGLSKLSMSEATPYPLVNLKTPVGGIFFGVNLGLFSIQPEILYVRMGTRMQESGSPDWMEIRLDYVQVPLLLKINVLPGPVSPMIYVGPYGAYRFAAKSAISGVSGSGDLSEDYKTTDYGIVLGGGIDFKLVVVKLSAEVRYNLGLANIRTNLAPGSSEKNRAIMALVGISF